VLALEAEIILSLVESLKGDGDHRATLKDAPLKIGAFEVFTTYFLGAFISQQVGNIGLEVHELLPGQIEEAIDAGRVDIGITYLPIPRAKLEFISMGKMEMGVFGLKKFLNQPFSDLPFVTPLSAVGSTPNRVRGLDGWPDHEVPRTIQHRVTLMQTALEFCKAGAAVGYFPRFVVQLFNESIKTPHTLVSLPSPIKLSTERQEVFLIKRQTSPETGAFRQIARALRKVCAGSGKNAP
jgi:DNA-binding transcriptional LysR family regulator